MKGRLNLSVRFMTRGGHRWNKFNDSKNKLVRALGALIEGRKRTSLGVRFRSGNRQAWVDVYDCNFL